MLRRPVVLVFAATVLLVAGVLVGLRFLHGKAPSPSPPATTDSTDLAALMDPKDPVVSQDWPGRDFHEVRLYYSPIPGGEHDLDALPPFISSKGGVPLTDDQVRRLRAAVTGPHPELPVYACFFPRHYFVFFDSSRRPVAEVDACFECLVVSLSSVGQTHRVNLSALADIVHELKLPLKPPPEPTETSPGS